MPAPEERPALSRREIEIPAASTTVPAFHVAPPEPTGAVLLVHDLFGRSPLYEALAADVAAEGLEVVMPDFFHELGPLPESTFEAASARRDALDEVASVEMLRDVLRWLRGRPGCRGRLGVVGFCMGGTFALDLCALERDLATVAFYGFPRPQPEIVSPPPAPLDLVERLEGPILARWGENDDIVGVDLVEEFVHRCEAAGRSLDWKLVPGLGHSYMTATPDDPELQARARATWHDALAHLRAHVGSAGA